MNSNLTITKLLSLSGDLSVGGNVTLQKQLNVAGDVSMGANIIVLKDASFNQNMKIGQNLTVNQRANMITDVSMGGNLVVLRDTTISGNLFVFDNVSFSKSIVANIDASFGGNVFVNNNLTVKNRVFVLKDASFSANIEVSADAKISKSLTVGNSVAISGEMSVQGNAIINQKLTVNNGQLITGNLGVAQQVNSKYYEGETDTGDIFIGYQGTRSSTVPPSRTIYIGSNPSGVQNTKNTIKIGGGSDVVLIGGNSGVAFDTVNAGKTINLNKTGSITSSVGCGLQITDGDNPTAGFFVVSENKSGYNFKAPSDQNIVKLDIPNLKLGNNVTTGLVTLTATPASADAFASFYTIGTGTIDISSILLKKTDILANTQVVDTHLGVTKNAYVQNSLSVGKTSASANISVDILGNVAVNNGYIWQF
jgi:acyl-[acyl carrier protein]--UDP-N-acetylglucosamine O-acyltransferase